MALARRAKQAREALAAARAAEQAAAQAAPANAQPQLAAGSRLLSRTFGTSASVFHRNAARVRGVPPMGARRSRYRQCRSKQTPVVPRRLRGKQPAQRHPDARCHAVDSQAPEPLADAPQQMLASEERAAAVAPDAALAVEPQEVALAPPRLLLTAAPQANQAAVALLLALHLQALSSGQPTAITAENLEQMVTRLMGSYSRALLDRMRNEFSVSSDSAETLRLMAHGATSSATSSSATSSGATSADAQTEAAPRGATRAAGATRSGATRSVAQESLVPLVVAPGQDASDGATSGVAAPPARPPAVVAPEQERGDGATSSAGAPLPRPPAVVAPKQETGDGATSDAAAQLAEPRACVAPQQGARKKPAKAARTRRAPDAVRPLVATRIFKPRQEIPQPRKAAATAEKAQRLREACRAPVQAARRWSFSFPKPTSPGRKRLSRAALEDHNKMQSAKASAASSAIKKCQHRIPQQSELRPAALFQEFSARPSTAPSEPLIETPVPSAEGRPQPIDDAARDLAQTNASLAAEVEAREKQKQASKELREQRVRAHQIAVGDEPTGKHQRRRKTCKP